MIKRARAIEVYQDNLYCDECGKLIKGPRGKYMTNPPYFEYICECGYRMTSRVQYPQVRYLFDLANAMEVKDEI